MIRVLNLKGEIIASYDNLPSDKDRHAILSCIKKGGDFICHIFIWGGWHGIKYVLDKRYFYKLR